MKKNVTAKDIAKLCGVSQATVSYVINNRQNQKISEETRRKVLDAVEALHYYPNASAKSMRTKNCTSIGIVCAKDYSRQAFLNAFTGISQYLSQIDYTITIFNEMDDIDSSAIVTSLPSICSKLSLISLLCAVTSNFVIWNGSFPLS